MSKLREYLGVIRRGTLVNKNNHFTLNKARSRRLARESQLLNPHDFLFKFVQASTLSAHGLTMVGNSRFDFWGWQTPDLCSIRHKLDNLLGGCQDDALGNVSIGLNALQNHSDLELEFYPCGSQTGQRLTLAKDSKLQAIQQIPRDPSVSIWQSVLRVILKNSRLKPRALSSLTRKRCPWARIRFVGSAKNPGGHTLSALRHRCGRKSLPPGAQALDTDDSWYILEQRQLAQATKIRLLKNGVILDEHSYPGLFGARLSLSVDHLATDLTGLQFIKNEEYLNTLKLALSLFAQNRPRWFNLNFRSQ